LTGSAPTRLPVERCSTAPKQNQIRNLVRQFVEFRVGAVGEDDDREFPFREPRDARAESDRIAVVKDLL